MPHAIPVPVSGLTGAANGIPGLFSRESFHLLWTEYQTFVIERLNQLIVGTQYEHMEPLRILKQTAREPSLAPVFNYASMAHNNHFFVNTLNPDSEENKPMEVPSKLKLQLEAQFSSMETLRREMILTASTMFGPGFVWLVKNHKSSQYRILTTYLAGSPYSEAHWRRQGIDMNTAPGPTSADDNATTGEYLERQKLGSGASHGSKWSKDEAPGGITVIPLLCVNTWEHVWLRDYGVGTGGRGGKRLYLENWWNSIDWNKVADAAQVHGKSLKL
ncbi:Manganese/iron superoxide dismutase [Pseudomassariella vexata]|uniref:Manganese/iron superoxide dismutase n=1 Tax=Pseudomassariella vexata TaxID=1141098 RepID=A0A1Y2E307_9PEZI|nr:Manganese/iron superoxide dismutase [Pseudomassariella vexata]ORY65889.1 Manganese/iron superoxide dismutase [Pseudomassariella vexata]